MIEIKNLYKYYGRKCAVKNVSFTAKRGEVVGFIGPNGAGKSSTMKIITGFMLASSGEVIIDGVNIASDVLKAKQKIGYLPESAPVYPGMTVQGFLRFCAEMRGFYGSEREQMVNDALDACFLQKVRKQSIETLSKGFRHRTSLAQAILGNPDILILDEPTDGLDPNQKHQVRKLIRQWSEEHTVILSTHILEEVEAVCDRLVLICGGEVRFDGTPNEFRLLNSMENVVEIVSKNTPAEVMDEKFSKQEWVSETIILSENKLQILPHGNNEILDQVYSFAKAYGWKIVSLEYYKGRLDDVFREITQYSKGGNSHD